MEKNTILICRVCGKELSRPTRSGKCLGCARKSLKRIFKENPELGDVWDNAMEELKKPKNFKIMVKDIIWSIKTIRNISI